MINDKIKSIVNQFINGRLGNWLKVSSGNALVYFRPKKTNQLITNGITLVPDDMSIIERLMRIAILKKLEKEKDYNALAELHQNYWSKQGAKFFSGTEGAFEKDFIPNCTFIFDELENILLNSPVQFDTLVEIGTGKGRVLNYLNSKFPKIKTFIGLDLSEAQIEINRETYKDQPKIEFYAADAMNWVAQHGQSATVFVTFGGVLEYFPEEQLKSFLKKINSLGATMFVVIEPNDNNHDFETDLHSKLYGFESSFSHNYPRLFHEAGFSLWHLSQKPSVYSSNMLTLIGAKN